MSDRCPECGVFTQYIEGAPLCVRCAEYHRKDRHIKLLQDALLKSGDMHKDEIERLRARVEKLEGQLEAEEMQSDMFVRRGDAYHERLMAVVAVANERDWADPVIRAFCQRIMTAAGFERCECGGSGELLVNTIESYQEPVRNPCPCVASGTTGWREA